MGVSHARSEATGLHHSLQGIGHILHCGKKEQLGRKGGRLLDGLFPSLSNIVASWHDYTYTGYMHVSTGGGFLHLNLVSVKISLQSSLVY